MMGFAFLFHWPVTFALVSRAAPAPVNSTMMGVAFLVLFVAGFAIGWLGGLYEPLGPVVFWTLHAAIGAVGGVLVLLVGRPLARALAA
jgi:POT family proton-dependent oligopeptide transporter